MNYLFRYLTTLKPSEVERALVIEWSPRERQLIDTLLALRGTSHATKQEAMERLAMSSSMFDKSCSTVLRAILDAAVPEGGSRLLSHLVDRSMHDLFFHELRRQEKRALSSASKEERRRFYRAAFDAVHRRFNSEYNERLGRQLGAKWRALDPSPDTAIYVEACLAGMAVWSEASQRSGGEAADRRLEKRLRRNDARITETTGPEASFRQLRSWIIYYGQLGYDPEERLRCLNEAARLCVEHPDVLTRSEHLQVLCQIAEEHYFYRTDLVKPLQMYRELYASYPDLMARNDYHTSKYIQLCIINGEYAEAEHALREYFGSEANLEVTGAGKSKNVAILWTKLLLMSDRLMEARRHLDDAYLLNQKSFYVQFEIECRMLHTALCYLEGDFDLVERRLTAHMKFLRSKGLSYGNSQYYPWYFKLVGALIDERTTGRRLSPKLEAKMEEFMEGAAAQYGVLLKKMRNPSTPMSTSG